ncbi:MAG: hypothetical protein RJA22_2635 [Verrucomicrobiota bacterium]|jgi:flagellar protein FliS
MALPSPWQSYRQVSTTTAPPGTLVLMLYDGVLRFLDQALRGFQLDDPLEFNQTINNNLTRAQEIIRELNYALDLERGGELAATLRRLYEYMDEQLHESNLHKRDAGIHEVIRRLTVLRDSWSEMLRSQGAGPGATAAGGLSVTG